MLRLTPPLTVAPAELESALASARRRAVALHNPDSSCILCQCTASASATAPSSASSASRPSRPRARWPPRCATQGYDVVQTTVSRDIAELGLVKVRAPSGRLVYAPPGTGDADRMRALATAVRRYALDFEVGAGHRDRDDPARLREPARAGNRRGGPPARRRHDRRREHDLHRRAGRRPRRPAARRAEPAPRGRSRSEPDGRRRLLRRPRYELCDRVAEGGLVRLRRGRRRDGGRRPGVRRRGVARARQGCRRRRHHPARPQGCLRRRPVREGDQDERALRGQVPARLGSLAPGDRPGGCRDRGRAGCRGRRPRLHRQGQRPAPLRARLQGALPRRARDRAAARPHLDARRGDRVRARQGHSGRRDAGLAVLDRRESLRAGDRGGRARGSLERAARGAVRDDAGPRDGSRAERGRARLPSRVCPSPSTATCSRSPS